MHRTQLQAGQRNALALRYKTEGRIGLTLKFSEEEEEEEEGW
jgi:hypothetical protein